MHFYFQMIVLSSLRADLWSKCHIIIIIITISCLSTDHGIVQIGFAMRHPPHGNTTISEKKWHLSGGKKVLTLGGDAFETCRNSKL